jgi:hypothetical protein
MQGELYPVIYGQFIGSAGSFTAIITDCSLYKNINLSVISTKRTGTLWTLYCDIKQCVPLKPHKVILYCIQIHCDDNNNSNSSSNNNNSNNVTE